MARSEQTINPYIVLMTSDCLGDILVLNRVLEKQFPGFREVWVGSAREVLDYLLREGKFKGSLDYPRPDIVLLADSRSIAGRFQTLRLARRRGLTKRIPFVVLAESYRPSDEQLTLQLGASLFVPQPVDEGEFDRQMTALEKTRTNVA